VTREEAHVTRFAPAPSTFVLISSIGLLAPFRSLAQAGSADAAAFPFKQGTDELAATITRTQSRTARRSIRCATIPAVTAIWIAVAQTQLGQLDDALKSCGKAISCASNDQLRTNSHAFKGNILRSMGDDPKKLSAAESEYRAAAQLDPNNAAVHFSLGIVLLWQSREPDGIAELNAYLRLARNGAEANYAKKVIANAKRAGGFPRAAIPGHHP
jgi:Tfp pilus assembly protein PilF